MSYEADSGDFTLTLVGDAMVNRRLSVYREPEYAELVQLLRSSDLTLSNLETQINEFELPWAQKPGSISWQVGRPECLDELKWMGIGAVTTANNHSYDYGEAGLVTTMHHLRERGLAFAGSGANLDEARAPALLDLPRGRVAVMGASTTFNELSLAGAARGDFPGRPGINGLRHHEVHEVPAHVFDALVDANVGLGYKEFELVSRQFHPHRAADYDESAEVRFRGGTYHKSNGYRTRTSCNPDDLAGIRSWIDGCARHADWLVYSTHCHESGATGEIHEVHRPTPPEFLVEFAHWTIDQGCHVFTGHGPHILRGIEIYRGRAIFYSLGNFVFHNETVARQPEPAYSRQGLGHSHTPGHWGAARSGDDTYGFPVDPWFFRTVVAECEHVGGALREIRLYPVELGFGRPRSQRGRPLLADAEVGAEILRWLQEVSEPFGTKIAVRDGVGVIEVA